MILIDIEYLPTNVVYCSNSIPGRSDRYKDDISDRNNSVASSINNYSFFVKKTTF